MKISTAICEYNPFHNGHAKHLEYIKNELKPDYIIIFLSGNFTQRGELAVTDKYTRATWAIKAGADAVIELPTVFATSTAEIFASGGVKLINSLPYQKSICFGSESGNVNEIFKVASVMINESDDVKNIIKRQLDKGESLLKARATAILESYKDINPSILNSPNDILALEYVKAIIKNNYDISVDTLKRIGASYNDSNLNVVASSALAIRTAILNGKLTNVKNSVPPYVYDSLPTRLLSLDKEVLYAILTSSVEDIKNTLECAEGLENKIKSLARDSFSVESLLNGLKTKRYTDARLRRILLASTLKISGSFVKECLNSPLYLKLLAINKNKPEILSVLANSTYPIITRKSDASKLKGVALKCFEKDVFANDVYSHITGKKLNEYDMKII